MKSGDPYQSPGSGEHDTGERIRNAGRDVVSDAAQDVKARMERGKSTAAESAHSTSEVLDHAAEEFSSQGQETLARATGVLAGKLSDLARQIENRSIDELSQDAIRLARNNPGLFVAGGIALGLALSRFAKATSPTSRAMADSGEGSYGSTSGSGAQSSPSTYGSGQPTGGSTYGSGQRSGGPAYGSEGAVPSQGSGMESSSASTPTGTPPGAPMRTGGDHE